jgi:hypothetical protein
MIFFIGREMEAETKVEATTEEPTEETVKPTTEEPTETWSEIIEAFSVVDGSCGNIAQNIFENNPAHHLFIPNCQRAFIDSLLPNIKWLRERIADGTATHANIENCALTHCRNVFYLANREQIETAIARIANPIFKAHEYKYPFLMINEKYKKVMKDLELKVFELFANGSDWLTELAYLQAIFCGTAGMNFESTDLPICFNNKFPFRDGVKISAEELIKNVNLKTKICWHSKDPTVLDEDEKQILIQAIAIIQAKLV